MYYSVYFDRRASALADLITGTAGDDVLGGYGGNDSLAGLGGDDIFFEGVGYWDGPTDPVFGFGSLYDFGTGSDTLDGGTGVDVVLYSGSQRAAVFDMAAGTITRGSEVDRLVSIEGVQLTDRGDRVLAAAGNIFVDLADGADTLLGLGSKASFDGGAGRDVLDLRQAGGSVVVRLDQGYSGINGALDVTVSNFEVVFGATSWTNTIYAGSNSSSLFGGTLRDRLWGNQGDDQIYGGASSDFMNGLDGADRILGGHGLDTIYGGTGNDFIDGGDHNDKIFGGAGNDQIIGGAGDDSIDGIVGNDSIDAGLGNDSVRSGSGADTISGGWGADTIEGGRGDNTLHGDQGNDLISALDGADLIFGDDGDDTISGTSYHSYNLPDTVYGGLGDDRINYAEDAATIYGGAGDDLIHMLSGEVYGELGNDHIVMGSSRFAYGAVRIDGGAGNDLVEIRLWNGGSPFVDGGAGMDTLVLSSPIPVDVATSFSALIYQTTRYAVGFETIIFSATDDWVIMHDGTWALDLLAGNDRITVLSSAGGVFHLGDGDDRSFGVGVFFGGNDNDTMSVRGSGSIAYGEAGNDSLNLQDGGTVYGGIGNDTISASLVYGLANTGIGYAEDGDDTALLSTQFGHMDMGNGNDLVSVAPNAYIRNPDGSYTEIEFDGAVAGGAGADTFDFRDRTAIGTLIIEDFDLNEDHIHSWVGSSLSDFTSAVQVGADVQLFAARGYAGNQYVPADGPNVGQLIVLENTLLSDLTDAIFA